MGTTVCDTDQNVKQSVHGRPRNGDEFIICVSNPRFPGECKSIKEPIPIFYEIMTEPLWGMFS